MVKLVTVMSRRGAMDRERFREHYETVHEPLAKKLPGLRRYRLNFALVDPERSPPSWDAIVEMWFDTIEELRGAWNTPQGRAAADDLTQFVDLGRTSWSVVEEREITV